MDPDNPVVRLCSQGMEAEGKGETDRALKLFMEAWNAASDDYERCIAAHYVARHQISSTETLAWNQRSLEHADTVGDVRVAGFYPSLYLNMGKANEDLGNMSEAMRFYRLAEANLHVVTPGRYRELVQEGIRRGIYRVTDK
jgi:hypothetical protein